MNRIHPVVGLLLMLAVGCGGGGEVARSEARSKETLTPALRRLSGPELDAAALPLLGKAPGFVGALPPDARQSDYSRNIAQSVDSLMLAQLYDTSLAASAEIDLTRAPFPDCADKAAPSDTACVEATIRGLARRAFRRVASEEELTDLVSLFGVGSSGADFRSGVQLVVRALLGSPKFMYVTSFGTDSADERPLGDAELASELSFLIGGEPPDGELMDAAAHGELRSADIRERQAIRLLGHPESRDLYRRFIEEWLGIVHLHGLAKSSAIAADFDTLREAMLSETDHYIDDVFGLQGGAISALLNGGYSIVPEGLANFYGIQAPAPGARVSLTGLGRVGLLQQPSFLATFAHETESAPVLRGKAVLTRLMCIELEKPSDLGIDIVFPPADPQATTRERFEQHATDPRCSGCHAVLDGIGFSFENFDAVGRLRSSESGRPLDTSGSLTLDGLGSKITDSVELSRALASSEQVRNCAARQVVRFAAGRSDERVERAFVDSLSQVSAERRGTFLGLFLQFVKSDWFVWRKPR